MAYFQELPNISYPSLLPNINKIEDTISVKNIFRRSKLRTDVDQTITAFNYYYVKESYRPDMVAEEIYNDSELDWVVLTSNNIINVRDQWPLGHNDLHNHIVEKYGSETNILDIHHYETIKIIDEYNRVILDGGSKVDANFTFTFVGTVSSTTGSLIKVKFGGSSANTITPVAAITNYNYETKLNEEKRKIKILKPQFLSVFITDHQNIMKYNDSSDYISNTLKGTYNPRSSGV